MMMPLLFKKAVKKYFSPLLNKLTSTTNII